MAEEDIRARIQNGGLIPLSISPLQQVLEDILDLIGKHEKSINSLTEALPTKTDKVDLDALREIVENNKADADSKFDELQKLLNEKSDALQKQIEENDAKVQDCLKDHADKIEMNQAQIEKMSHDLKDLEDKLNQEMENVNGKVEKMDGTIKDHENRITELENRKFPENTANSISNAEENKSDNAKDKELSQNASSDNNKSESQNPQSSLSQGNSSTSNTFDPSIYNELKQLILNNSDKIQNNSDRIRALENAQLSALTSNATPSNSSSDNNSASSVAQNANSNDQNLNNALGLLGRRLNTAEEAISDLQKALRDLQNNQKHQNAGNSGSGGAVLTRNYPSASNSNENGSNSNNSNNGNSNLSNNAQNNQNGLNSGSNNQNSSGLASGNSEKSNSDSSNHSNAPGVVAPPSGASGVSQSRTETAPRPNSRGNNMKSGVTIESSKNSSSIDNGASKSSPGNSNSSNNGSLQKSNEQNSQNNGNSEDHEVRPPSSTQKTSPRQSNLQPLPDLVSSDPNEALSQLSQRLAALEQQLSDQNASTDEELKKINRDLNDRPNRALIERLFEKFKSSIGNVIQMVQAKEGNDGKFATVDDVKRLENLIKHMTQEFDEAAAARKCTKCLSCGMGYRTVTGSIQDSETAQILGAAPVSMVTQSPGKPAFVYGTDNELYYSMNGTGRTFASPRRELQSSK
ncbi:hypothetical protein TVAG_192980 [Trichomonas vaginalis G3]|uniref:Uncharacterized protein n=1 Tax=Trichomonas vaginalis (strain ATCC PRA-98 / G3) TaxID=412133 RepID=A2DH12_TRIV3|nr:Apolipoprotein A-I family [Trichomonas vaginalis G3]EAY20322.1 hypothetical protein TVAG_192980 [Trichomonas vaginalis G3]KAI5530689.1 Apolipoprotein A-I family [Trichomonas vaginalis G3]|eukprot:XP_001581308.1 hypothetical protein [Trichomonas vaginalis G3]